MFSQLLDQALISGDEFEELRRVDHEYRRENAHEVISSSSFRALPSRLKPLSRRLSAHQLPPPLHPPLP